MTQTEQIRRYLANGGTLSAISALNRFGCLRLAARVRELRDEYGDSSVITTMRTIKGKRIAFYRGTDELG